MVITPVFTTVAFSSAFVYHTFIVLYLSLLQTLFAIEQHLFLLDRQTHLFYASLLLFVLHYDPLGGLSMLYPMENLCAQQHFV